MVEKNEELTIYNQKKTYNNEILPLINQIKIVCAKNNLPFFCTCPVVSSEDETKYETDGYFTGSSGINLKKDHIVNMIKVLRGVELKPIGAVQLNEEDLDYISASVEDAVSDNSLPVNNSWFELFHKNIYSNIDDKPYRQLFPDMNIAGVSIKTIISVLILKEIFNLNDEEMINNIVFNPQYKNALGISENIPKISTLDQFRVMCNNYAVICGNELLYNTITGLSAYLSKLDFSSENINNNIRDYIYLRTIYKCNESVCLHISKTKNVLSESLEKYIEPSGFYENVLYCEPKNVKKKLMDILLDSDIIIKDYSSILFDQMDFQSLFNILNNYVNQKNTESQENNVYENEESFESFISLNNEDDDIIEEYEDVQDDKNLSDEAEIEEIDEVTIDDIDENYKNIINEDIDTLETDGQSTPSKEKFVGRKPNEIILSFEIDKAKDCIAKCPKGIQPLKSHYDIKLKKYFTTMRRDDCENCPNRDACKAKIHKRVSNITFSKKSILRLKR